MLNSLSQKREGHWTAQATTHEFPRGFGSWPTLLYCCFLERGPDLSVSRLLGRVIPQQFQHETFPLNSEHLQQLPSLSPLQVKALAMI